MRDITTIKASKQIRTEIRTVAHSIRDAYIFGYTHEIGMINDENSVPDDIKTKASEHTYYALMDLMTTGFLQQQIQNELWMARTSGEIQASKRMRE